MWWEAIPSFAIVVGCLTATHFIPAGLAKGFYDNIHLRNVTQRHNYFYFQRDRSHADTKIFSTLVGMKVGEGVPYYAHGLEALSDKAEK